MPLPALFSGLRLPVIAAPMFLTSGPDLVVETCRGGMVGTFPALNQRSTDSFVAWLDEINERLAGVNGAAPFGVNLIVHNSNPRLEADLAAVVRHKVPLVITSLGAVRDVVDAVHSYGGLVFHDVINRRHAEKAAEAGVDGIVGVSAGAGDMQERSTPSRWWRKSGHSLRGPSRCRAVSRPGLTSRRLAQWERTWPTWVRAFSRRRRLWSVAHRRK